MEKITSIYDPVAGVRCIILLHRINTSPRDICTESPSPDGRGWRRDYPRWSSRVRPAYQLITGIQSMPSILFQKMPALNRVISLITLPDHPKHFGFLKINQRLKERYDDWGLNRREFFKSGYRRRWFLGRLNDPTC